MSVTNNLTFNILLRREIPERLPIQRRRFLLESLGTIHQERFPSSRCCCCFPWRRDGAWKAPLSAKMTHGGGSGGGGGKGGFVGGIVMNDGRLTRKSMTVRGFFHKSTRLRFVGTASHSNKWGTVWRRILHSGQTADVPRPVKTL